MIISVNISAGNVDDRTTVLKMVKKSADKLSGNKGYIKSFLVDEFLQQELELITTVKKTMKKVVSDFDRLLLRERGVIETADDLFKNYFHIEHSRHRSSAGFMNNLLTGLIAYTYYPAKPQMKGVDIQKALVC